MTSTLQYYYDEPDTDLERWIIVGEYSTTTPFEGEGANSIADCNDKDVFYYKGKCWLIENEEDLRCTKKNLTIEETLKLFCEPSKYYDTKALQESFLEAIKEKDAFVLDIERSMDTGAIVYLQAIPITRH